MAQGATIAAATARAPRQLADDAPHLLLVDDDRRQRLLYATPKGEALVAKLAGLQTDRITSALRDINPEGVAAISQFLRAMIDRDDPDKVLEAIFGTGSRKPRE